MGNRFGTQLARGLANARDLKPGQTIQVDGSTATVISISYCNGSNGEPPRLHGAIDEFTKTAATLKINLDGRDPIYVHPGQTFAV